MKNVINKIAACVLCGVTALLGMTQSVSIAADYDNMAESLINEYVECRNDKNVDRYVQLFSSDIQKEMNDYIDECGIDSFFSEEYVEIISVKEGDVSVASEEKTLFKDVRVYEVIENIVYKKDKRRGICDLQDGINVNNYILVMENGEWYLHRISNVGVPESTVSVRSSLVCPSSTTIYFTKEENRNYWGAASKALDFESEYLPNVLPKEWYISR